MKNYFLSFLILLCCSTYSFSQNMYTYEQLGAKLQAQFDSYSTKNTNAAGQIENMLDVYKKAGDMECRYISVCMNYMVSKEDNDYCLARRIVIKELVTAMMDWKSASDTNLANVKKYISDAEKYSKDGKHKEATAALFEAIIERGKYISAAGSGSIAISLIESQVSLMGSILDKYDKCVSIDENLVISPLTPQGYADDVYDYSVTVTPTASVKDLDDSYDTLVYDLGIQVSRYDSLKESMSTEDKALYAELVDVITTSNTYVSGLYISIDDLLEAAATYTSSGNTSYTAESYLEAGAYYSQAAVSFEQALYQFDDASVFIIFSQDAITALTALLDSYE